MKVVRFGKFGCVKAFRAWFGTVRYVGAFRVCSGIGQTGLFWVVKVG